MKVTLKQLHVFVLTAQYGCISDAAEHCFLSQPAASMSLRQLELALATPLFDRAGKRLLINRMGQSLLPRALEIINRTHELELIAKQGEGVLSGEINIGCTLTIGSYLLPPYLAKFKRQYPQVEVRVVMNNTQYIVKQTLALDLDIALIEGTAINNPRLDYEKWRDDPMVVIARRGHPLLARKNIDRNHLGLYSWILREKGSGTAALIEHHAFGKFDLDVEMVLSDFEAIKNYVANSDCLSCVSSASISQLERARLQIVPVPRFSFSRPLCFVTNKDKYQSAASFEFKETIRM